jgi:dihydroorotate dehydrogenase
VVNERNSITNMPPVLVKIAPDLTEPEIESIATAVKDSHVDGVIVSNTTIARPQSLKSSQSLAKEVGGLSGKPVKPYSLQALQLLRQHLGPDITIIGCGGISSGKDAIEFANAGADFVQLYTSFAYKGPSICGDIKSEILEELQGRKWADVVNRNQ